MGNMFFLHTLDLLVPNDHHLNSTTSLSVADDHAFMTAAYTSSQLPAGHGIMSQSSDWFEHGNEFSPQSPLLGCGEVKILIEHVLQTYTVESMPSRIKRVLRMSPKGHPTQSYQEVTNELPG